MKIAILTSGILPVPAVQGGAVENLIDFYLEYNNLHRLHDITVYSVWHPDVEKHLALKSEVNHYQYINTSTVFAKMKRRLYKFSHSNEYYNYFIEFFFEEACRQIKKEQYDCIILENRPGYTYKLSRRGGTLGKNIVLHLHNDLLNSETPYAQYIYNSLKRVVTVSDYIKQRVETIPNTIPSDTDAKVVTVYNGIYLQHFTKSNSTRLKRKEFGFSEKDFVLAYSGRLNKEKGIAQLIDAMLLLKDLPQIKLMIMGSTFFANATNEDSFVQTLKEKALPIKEQLVFTGFVPYDQVPDYLELADMAVIPSVWAEPFGLTVVEAQAMGLPTIVSNQGGIPEIVNDKCAIIIPTDSHYEENLADAIRQLYHSPQRRAEMAAASLRNAAGYGKERYARDFFKALESKE